MTETQENEKEETATPEPDAPGADDMSTESTEDSTESPEEAKKSGNKMLPFLLILGGAAVLTMYLASLKPEATPEDMNDMTMQEEEVVSEEVAALRAGEGAVLGADFTPASCEGTYTHMPVGFSFVCPEGWWHPFEDASPDEFDPNHFTYETAFTSLEVEAPGELGDEGLWLAVDTGTRVAACDPPAPQEGMPEVVPTTVAGEDAFMQDITFTDQMGNPLFSGRRVGVAYNQLCYQISLFHLGGEPLSDDDIEVMNGILDSFSFNR